MDVRANRVDDIDDAPRHPGIFEYHVDKAGQIVGMGFICPCGCGDDCAVSFRPAPSPSWDWDGNADAPTLSPSVHRQVKATGGGLKTHWHGWLQGGVWRSC